MAMEDQELVYKYPLLKTVDSLSLRKLVCQEWITHKEDYEVFLANSTVEDEVKNFQNPGYLMGDLGDTMPLAMSNALGAPIVIITSDLCTPFMCINPRHNSFSNIIYLAYHKFGAGHYDGILCEKPGNVSSASKEVTVKNKCNCGVNNKLPNKMHCLPIKMKYTEIIKCPCLMQSIPCNNDCCCKGCCNSFGNRPQLPQKRERHVHCWQGPIPKSYGYALQSGEMVNTGGISLTEYFVVYEIDQFLPDEDIELVFDVFCACMHEPEKTTNAKCLQRSLSIIDKIRNMINKKIGEFENQCPRSVHEAFSSERVP